MESTAKCARCGQRRRLDDLGKIDDRYVCHGNTDPSPTCYETETTDG